MGCDYHNRYCKIDGSKCLSLIHILRLLGDGCRTEAEAVQKIPKGHKIALQNIRAGEDVIKYGVRIARASKDIRAGEWVHLHNIRSCLLYTSISVVLLETG